MPLSRAGRQVLFTEMLLTLGSGAERNESVFVWFAKWPRVSLVTPHHLRVTRISPCSENV